MDNPTKEEVESWKAKAETLIKGDLGALHAYEKSITSKQKTKSSISITHQFIVIFIVVVTITGLLAYCTYDYIQEAKPEVVKVKEDQPIKPPVILPLRK